MAAQVRVDPGALAAARAGLDAAARDLRSEQPAVRSVADAASDGAGEFAPELALGLAAFRLSWDVTLDVLADSAELVSTQVEQARAEYARREAALSRTFR